MALLKLFNFETFETLKNKNVKLKKSTAQAKNVNSVEGFKC